MENKVLDELEFACRPIKSFLERYGNHECKVEVSHKGAKMVGSMYDVTLERGGMDEICSADS